MAKLQLNDACKQQHQEVLDKGFDNFDIPKLLMLIVTELGEACEADRKNRHANDEQFLKDFPLFPEYNRQGCFEGLPDAELREAYKENFERHIKDTFEDEIADAFLRLMDLCGAYGIDIEKYIYYKQIYNRLRPTKHGKAY